MTTLATLLGLLLVQILTLFVVVLIGTAILRALKE